MSKHRQLSAEERAAIKIAACQRVEAVWTCLGVLRPDLTPQGKKALAEKVFELSRGKDQKPPQIKITPAQVQEIVWRNSQCANRYCSMVLFSREIAEELNEFFKGEE
jgi:hypothetical protein